MRIDEPNQPTYKPSTDMPLPEHFNTAADEIRRLIRESKTPLKQLAADAGVPYTPLWKWLNGRQPNYNLLAGEAVYYTLTGRTFLKSVKPIR